MIGDPDVKAFMRLEAKALDLLNEILALRMSLARPERDPWMSLKAAARRIGKSERATWRRAQRIPECTWVDGGRRKVNVDLLEVIVFPPSSPHRR